MSYIISEKTLALIAKGKKTKVIEFSNTFTSNESIRDIISENCCLNGSTIAGRQQASSYLLGVVYKPPIIINEYRNIIFIPTASFRNCNCNWISLSSILHYQLGQNNKVILELSNHFKLYLTISYNVFDKQVLRATRLETYLKEQKNKNYL